MTEYGVKLLSNGDSVSFGSSGLPHRILLKGDGSQTFVVCTKQASMEIPLPVLEQMIEYYKEVVNPAIAKRESSVGDLSAG